MQIRNGLSKIDRKSYALGPLRRPRKSCALRIRSTEQRQSPTAPAFNRSAFFFLALLLISVEVLAGPPRHPFPQNISYATGSLIPNHRSMAEINEDVRSLYRQWRSDYLVQAGTEPDLQPRYRVRTGTTSSEPTVSEGQGYGMIIVALMAGEDADAQTVFDGLWEFFNDHRSEIDPRLMDWHVPADESAEPGHDDSAFDGDCDIAFSLLLAEAQWGNGGRIDYRAEFDDILAGIAASTIGPESHLPMLGDWVDPAGSTYNQYTPRTSDLMPGHFHCFASITGNSLWNEVSTASSALIESLQADFSPTTGLLPDFVVPISASDHSPQPAPPNFLEGPHDGEYYYNAGRDPWRLTTDALLNADAPSKAQALRMAQWIRSSTGGDASAIRGGYSLDGTIIGDYFTSFFAAPFGVAAMIDPLGQSWLNAVYDSVRLSHEGYYEDSVTLLSMLLISRNFWDPSTLIFAGGFEEGTFEGWSAVIPAGR